MATHGSKQSQVKFERVILGLFDQWLCVYVDTMVQTNGRSYSINCQVFSNDDDLSNYFICTFWGMPGN